MSIEQLTNNCKCDYCLFARYGSNIFIASFDESHTQIDSGAKRKEGSADDYGTLVIYRSGNTIIEVDVGGQSQRFGYKGDKARAETRRTVGNIFGPSTDIR